MRKKQKKGSVKKVVVIVIVIVILIFLLASIIGGQVYMKKDEKKKKEAPGNAESYNLENIEAKSDSPLKGKNILFLGSSVTVGASSFGISFADYIGKIDGVNVTKEAVSSTTLVDEWSIMAFLSTGNGDSYISRLNDVDINQKFDMVVCQLSTNDATQKKELGTISDSEKLEDFDTKTITGAMEYIICYSKENWGCPVVFYTGSYYESDEYAAMVDRLVELQDKWEIGVVNLYDDKEFNDIDEETYDFYMHDKIHPTKAGYLEWWTPAIEEVLYEYIGN